MRTVAHSGLLLLSGIFLCSAALSISTVRSWAEDENPSAHDEKLNPPRKLTGRDAANALVGNTIAGYDARDGIFVFFLAPDGSLEVPAAQATGLPPKWAIRGEQLCLAHTGEPSASECTDFEVEGMRATAAGGDAPGGHHLKAKMWILPGNAFNFPKGTIEEMD